MSLVQQHLLPCIANGFGGFLRFCYFDRAKAGARAKNGKIGGEDGERNLHAIKKRKLQKTQRIRGLSTYQTTVSRRHKLIKIF